MEENRTTNKVLIIGNGFDLYLNYQTSYNQFIEFIGQKKYEMYKEKINPEKFSDMISNNHLINFFLNCVKDAEWAGVERELKRIICSIRNSFSNTRNIDMLIGSAGRIAYFKELKGYEKLVLLDMDFINSNNYIHSKYYHPDFGLQHNELQDYLCSELEGLKEILIYYLKYYVPIIEGSNVQAENLICFV